MTTQSLIWPIALFVALLSICSLRANNRTHTVDNQTVEAMVTKMVAKSDDLVVQQQAHGIFAEINALSDSLVRASLLKLMLQAVQLYLDIDGLRTAQFLSAQFKLIRQAIQAIQLARSSGYCSLEEVFKSHVRLIRNGLEPFGVLKLRPGNCNEAHVWIGSHLFACSDLVVPACLIHSHGQDHIFQPYVHCSWFQPDQLIMNRISPFEYWRTVLFTILFGYHDLYSANIGVRDGATFIFFDNESTFPKSNTLKPLYHYEKNKRHCYGVFIPYINLLVDLPLGQELLTVDLRNHLRQWLQSMKTRLVDFQKYLAHPLTEAPPGEKEQKLFLKRFQKLMTFFQRDQLFSLQEVVHYVYPYYVQDVVRLQKMVHSILEKTAQPVRARFEKSVGALLMQPITSPSQAFIFIAKFMHWWATITDLEKKELLSWVRASYKFQHLPR